MRREAVSGYGRYVQPVSSDFAGVVLAFGKCERDRLVVSNNENEDLLVILARERSFRRVSSRFPAAVPSRAPFKPIGWVPLDTDRRGADPI